MRGLFPWLRELILGPAPPPICARGSYCGCRIDANCCSGYCRYHCRLYCKCPPPNAEVEELNRLYAVGGDDDEDGDEEG